MELNIIYNGESLSVLKTFPSDSIDCIITSPPYFNIRDYKHKDQIGREKTPQEYISKLIDIFGECKRVLKKEGSIWVNIADSYSKNKSLIGIPERFALAMTDELGLIRRNTIIWKKNNCMPSSIKDRFTIDYEFFLFLTKSPKYYFETQYEPLSPVTLKEIEKKYKGKGIKDYEGNGVQNPSDVKRRIIHGFAPFGGKKYKEYGNRVYSGKEYKISLDNLQRIKRTVWTINTQNFKGAHFATFPMNLLETPIRACCPENGIILDCFMGSGTTALVAKKLNRNYIGIEINSDYCKISENRINEVL